MKVKKVIDLSHFIMNEMPFFPGDPKPEVIQLSTVKEKGYRLSKITLGSHTGTHVDAPCHMIDAGATVDELHLDDLMGEAAVLDLSHISPGEAITLSHLQPNDVREDDIVLLFTGMSKRWDDKKFLTDYSHLSLEAANWMVKKKVKAVGIDCMSIEKPGGMGHPVHDTLLSHKIPIIESLANLDRVKGMRIFFICLPLKLKNTDGAPARALAIEFEV